MNSSISDNKTAKVAPSTVKIIEKLTEDAIKEHNTLHGSLGRGSGSSFTSVTKTYIIKWTMENVLSNETPFEAGQIPIESFGQKILDEPQYLKNSKDKNNGKNGEVKAVDTTKFKELVKVIIEETSIPGMLIRNFLY